MASFMHVAVSILLLSTLTSAQMRGDNSFAQDICNPNDGDDDVCSDKKPDMDRELDQMEQDLEDLANLTRGAQDKVVYLKDSETQAQKQAPGSAIYHYLWIEKFFNKSILSIVQANEKRIIDLKQMSVQLDQMCKEPCKDTAEIQTVTGKDCQDIANKGGKVSGLYYVKPARVPEAFLVYCEIDSFGHGWTVLQRVRDVMAVLTSTKNGFSIRKVFGYLSPDDRTEFWLGNEKIFLLSVQSSVPYVLRIEMVDWDGNKKYADYATWTRS
uniref:Fibrinogen gamma chain n=1 Tax=Cyprinus carpio TaxID=7962 RepID=A0A8C1VVD6_CYPCA